MGSEEMPSSPDGDDGGDKHAEQSNDALASKLSKELNNWRRRRTNGRPRSTDSGGNGKYQSEPARTIRVRGHETLVIRKPKPVVRPGSNSTPDSAG